MFSKTIFIHLNLWRSRVTRVYYSTRSNSPGVQPVNLRQLFIQSLSFLGNVCVWFSAWKWNRLSALWYLGVGSPSDFDKANFCMWILKNKWFIFILNEPTRTWEKFVSYDLRCYPQLKTRGSEISRDQTISRWSLSVVAWLMTSPGTIIRVTGVVFNHVTDHQQSILLTVPNSCYFYSTIPCLLLVISSPPSSPLLWIFLSSKERWIIIITIIIIKQMNKVKLPIFCNT